MAELKTGARLKSAVCDGEIMVVATPGGDIALTCGGAPMIGGGVAAGEEAQSAEIDPDHAVGIVIGKRYITEDEGLEVLCVKAGAGSLAVDGNLLLQKDTKKLPKTD